MIADIARRVAKTGRYTETAELMAKAMHEQGYSAAKIQAEVMKLLNADPDYKMFVAENTNEYKKEIQRIIKETVEKAKEAGDELVAEAGDMAWNADLSMWSEQGVDLKKPNSMSQLREAFTKQTVNELRNLTRTTGFRNANTGTVGIMNAYQRELDLAVLKVATGIFGYDQAVKDCVHRLAQSGLRSINYASGRSYQLDTAARMCVRTGCSQLAGKIMEENLKTTGQDLVITSQHMGSRPEHAPWQNKVFSYSGKSKKYPDFFKETGYGTVTGLKGANCTHDFYPFWEGISVIPEDIKVPDPVTINGKTYTYYECTQKQRSMERDIRALKREINASETLGMDSTELRSKLSMKKAEYEQFSASAHLRTKENRLRVQVGTYKKFGADAGLKVKQDRLRVTGGTSDLKKTNEKLSAITQNKGKKDNHVNTPNIKKKDLDNMSLSELQKLAEETAVEYYKSGISGISFGEKSVEDVAKELSKLGNKTSLKKDILSMQKKMNKQLANAAKNSKITLTDTDVKAVHDYMSAKSYVINEKLRMGTSLLEDEKQFVNDLNTALNKMPKYEGNLQRSLYFNSNEDVANFMSGHKIGEPITYNEFVSTTKGELYNPEGQVQIFIQNAKNGRDISSINESEQEILYKNGTSFDVLNIVEKDGTHYILLGEKE